MTLTWNNISFRDVILFLFFSGTRAVFGKTMFKRVIIIALLASVSVAVSRACSANPADASVPSLSGVFTLRYEGHVAATAVGLDIEKRLARAQAEKLVENGTMTRSDASEYLKRYDAELSGMSSPGNKVTVTISSDGAKTLFDYRYRAQENVLIYDGTKSDCISSSDSRAYIEPGFAAYRMFGQLIFGVNFRHIDFIKQIASARNSSDPIHIDCDVMSIGARGKDPRDPVVYLPATAVVETQDGAARLKSLDVTSNGNPLTTWDFGRYIRFAGRCLPSEIKRESYATLSPGTLIGGDTYDLVSTSPACLPAEKFKIESYITDQKIVQDDFGTPSVAIHYDAKGGDLDRQIDNTRNQEKLGAINASKGQLKARANSGILALVGLCFAGAAWLTWRQARRKANP